MTEASQQFGALGTGGAGGSPTHGLDGVLADDHLMDEWQLFFQAAGIPVIEPRFDPEVLARIALRATPESSREDLIIASDPARLRPIYPRVPEAVRLWKEHHGA